MILDRSNCFGLVQIGLVGSNSFWKIQIILARFKLDYFFMIWTRPKKLVPFKMIWTVQKSFWIHRRTRHFSAPWNSTIWCMETKCMHYHHALSFYGYKMILDNTNHFVWVPIVLDGSNSFCLDPNHFGQVQIIKISPEKYNLNQNKMIWTRPE